MRTRSTLELSDANPMMLACKAAAVATGANVSIAIVDDAGVLLSFERFDGAKAHSVELAQRKARTAAMLGVSTAVLETMAREGRLNNSEILALGGGLPVMHAGQCVGAIGVSGSTAQMDNEIAAAGLKACSNLQEQAK
jgi:glc operon protein GlcG